MNLEISIDFKYRKFWFFLYSIVQKRCNRLPAKLDEIPGFSANFGPKQNLRDISANFRASYWFTEDFRGSRNSERKFAPPVDPRETFQRNFRFTWHAKLVAVKATYFTTKHMEFPLWSSLHANCNRSNLVTSIVSMRFSIWSIFLNIHMYSC